MVPNSTATPGNRNQCEWRTQTQALMNTCSVIFLLLLSFSLVYLCFFHKCCKEKYPQGGNAPILPFLSLSELTDSSPPVSFSASTSLLSRFFPYFTEPVWPALGNMALPSSPHAKLRTLLCRAFAAHTSLKVIYSRLSSRCSCLHSKREQVLWIRTEPTKHGICFFMMT